MCGIVGAVAKFNGGFSLPAVEAFEDLLFMDTLRGPDSTGVVCVDKFGYTNIVKGACPAYWMSCEKEYDPLILRKAYKEGKILIGHNRKATVGKVNEENAHPFIVNKELVLVHNGSLTTHKHLSDTEVDSHAIAKYIHEHWKEDAEPEIYTKMFRHIGGAYALVWYDLRHGKLNIVRNSQRPLFLAETTSEFFWASEKEMLQAGLARNNLTVKTLTQVDTQKLYSFDITEDAGHETKLKEVAFPTVPFPVKSQDTTKPPVSHFPKTPMGLVVTAMGKALNGTDTADSEDESVVEQISKARFKKFIKHLVGKEIDVFVEDFTETSKENEYWFYGTNPNYMFNHEIAGVCTKRMADYVTEDNMHAVGVISQVHFTTSERKVTFTVDLKRNVKQPLILTH